MPERRRVPRKNSAHAYVYVDGAPYIGSPASGQLLRVPLAGGTPQVVSAIGSTGAFAASGDTTFWVDNGDWKTASGSSDASVFSSMSYAQTAVTDATSLYYVDANGYGLHRLPLAGGSDQILTTPAYPFAITGDIAYGIEPVTGLGMTLDRVSKIGGTWQRLQALGTGYPIGKLQVVGDRYYLDARRDFGESACCILTGLLTSSGAPSASTRKHDGHLNAPPTLARDGDLALLERRPHDLLARRLRFSLNAPASHPLS